MRESIGSESSFQIQDQIQNQQIYQIKQRWKQAFIALVIFCLFVATLSFYRIYFTVHIIQDGLFYENQLSSMQMINEWEQMAQKEMKTNNDYIIAKGNHNITRQQLRHSGWIILHLITGSFPEVLNQNIVKKWNIFLTLFAQFYPSKRFSKNFLKLLKEVGPFKGKSKEQLMVYLCEIHNIVNKRINKRIHNCKDIKAQWDIIAIDQF